VKETAEAVPVRSGAQNNEASRCVNCWGRLASASLHPGATLVRVPAASWIRSLRIAIALAPILLLGVAAGAATPPGERPQPGAFCTPASCRDAAASPWTAAAFGAAVLVIHRSARSRPTR
jgi:hypothetical protein